VNRAVCAAARRLEHSRAAILSGLSRRLAGLTALLLRARNGAILLATLVFIGRFDFGNHPGGRLYAGLYVVVFALTAWQPAADRRLRQTLERAMHPT
jgi:hypothetical protein